MKQIANADETIIAVQSTYQIPTCPNDNMAEEPYLRVWQIVKRNRNCRSDAVIRDLSPERISRLFKLRVGSQSMPRNRRKRFSQSLPDRIVPKTVGVTLIIIPPGTRLPIINKLF